ncbi:MAG: type II toxin-antitoxin system VapC family toxin [Blastocatellia bacterium]|nr:type II toxin-antitoxin system VapC family toxin [Blastocatellia bacterium]MDQ3118103.1 type II toxin-antitoxin system VapC family toxin [Verrucomicrobiota bacterium]
MKLCFDTTFLIDLQKERGAGRAHTFLSAHREANFFWSAIVAGEFAEGFASADDPVLVHYLRLATVLDVTKETAMIYSRLARGLRGTGKLIGSNDLWIASHALQHRLTLVTNDRAHFRRVRGLPLLGY